MRHSINQQPALYSPGITAATYEKAEAQVVRELQLNTHGQWAVLPRIAKRGVRQVDPSSKGPFSPGLVHAARATPWGSVEEGEGEANARQQPDTLFIV